MAKKILLIEDDLFIRDLYERALTEADYTVIAVADGEQGVKRAQDKPDLILLDIMIPKLDGLGVLRKLKGDPSVQNIPVVLLTNLSQEGILKEAFKIGAAGYLLKMNLTPFQVVDRVKEFLENPGKIDHQGVVLD